MNKNITIETERLILRQWNMNDIDDMVEGLNNINVTKWLAGAPFPYTAEDAKYFIQNTIDKDLYNFAEIVPVSSMTGDNTNRLIEVIRKYLTDTVKYFPDEEVTSEPIEKRLTEIVREKVLLLTDDEVPHSVHCVLTDINEENNIVNVYVDIIVDRESLKKIIIGKKGLMLKEIGMKARKDMEVLLGRQVYLELYVRVLKKWRDKEKYLNELGFNEY